MIIPMNYGLSQLPNTVDAGRWAEVLRLSILKTLHSRFPAQQPLYDLESLLRDDLELDDEARDRAKDLLEYVANQLEHFHEVNNIYTRYNVVPTSGVYYIINLGDHRILEWEAGRGKPQEELVDEDKEFADAVEVSWGVPKGHQHPEYQLPEPPKGYNSITYNGTPPYHFDTNLVINGPGHSTLKPPSKTAHQKWVIETFHVERHLLATADVCVVANWRNIGFCAIPIESGTLLRYRCINEDGMPTGYLSRV